MRDYRERLGVPASWWLVITACVVLLGTTLWAGLSLRFAVVIYVALESACALVLLTWGATTIEVAAGELKAGSRRLPLGLVAEVTGLTKAQTAALRGPKADPAAYLLVRPYLPKSVYVAIAGRAGQPYWLIGTRHPDELAAAIERAAVAAPAQDYAAAAPDSAPAVQDNAAGAGTPP